MDVHDRFDDVVHLSNKPTYKGLKRSKSQRRGANKSSNKPTYKGLKLPGSRCRADPGNKPTYKGLKRIEDLLVHKLGDL